ncbi:MAG: hypothetical protein IGR92_16100 [Leptolyngbyaceae cyanobacterium T60_A2020_046]|nr:hypothetical protein [Leptolyngbyaceae cyanobacterium T60_A2020_046]
MLKDKTGMGDRVVAAFAPSTHRASMQQPGQRGCQKCSGQRFRGADQSLLS